MEPVPRVNQIQNRLATDNLTTELPNNLIT